MRVAALRRLLRASALILVAAGALTVGCGRKTDVRPPEFVAPARITDLEAVNAVGGVGLGWRRPKQTADGQPLFDLDAFVVERAAPGLPFEFLARVPIPDRDRLRQQKRFTYVDAGAEVGQVYRYRALAVTLDGYVSAPSNVVEILRAVPTATPHAVATPAASPAPTR